MLSDKAPAGDEPFPGKSTLNRLELSTEKADRYKIHCSTEAIDELLVQVFLEAHTSTPERIVWDLDVTDLALHGHQQGRFFYPLQKPQLEVGSGESCSPRVRAFFCKRAICWSRYFCS